MKSIARRRKIDWVSLDVVNFCSAEVRDGAGPFLAVFLVTTADWGFTDIGIVLACKGMASVLAQPFVTYWMDRSGKTRIWTGYSSVIIGACSLCTVLVPDFRSVLFSQCIVGAFGTVIPPGTYSLAVRVARQGKLTERIGRNESITHLGRILTALLMGISGYLHSDIAIFYLLSILSVVLFAFCMQIRKEKQNNLKRSHCRKKNRDQSDWRKIFSFKFGICVLVIFLFHLANAAMLPLTGQIYSNFLGADSSLFLSFSMAIAEIVMVWTAWKGAIWTKRFDTKTILLAGLVSLPIRGILFALNDSALGALAIQILDGIGAGIVGVTSILLVGNVTRTSGFHNLPQGILTSALLVGTSISNGIGEYFMDVMGKDSTFLALSGLSILPIFLAAVFLKRTIKKPIPKGGFQG